MPLKNLVTSPYQAKPRKNHVPVCLVPEKNYKAWLNKQTANIKRQAKDTGFDPKGVQILIARNKSGHVDKIFFGVHSPVRLYDVAECVSALKKNMSDNFFKSTSFELNGKGFKIDELERAHIGWGLACYQFDQYKKSKSEPPALVISKSADKKRVVSFVEGIDLTRNLVNIPANDMGPDELEKAAKTLAAHHKAEFAVIKDKDLIKNNFPLIYTVGQASTRRPRLLDLRWGNKKHSKVTLVGKGVCFDTGGLDIKPSQFMLSMKKDMGGAAHVLGLAHLIMSLKLPICLRVLIPAVENAVAGNAYRPGDILKSRKGITIENGNTDAEGRLVLADALTYASEEKPDLMIDFATLTGAARVAVGYDLPALFANKDKTADEIKKLSARDKVGDPVWPLPLWQPYRKDMESPVADISSTGRGKAGATTAALFLQEFVGTGIEWVHMDVYAWEQYGKPGRPQGGADTGLRAIFAFLEKRYGKKA